MARRLIVCCLVFVSAHPAVAQDAVYRNPPRPEFNPWKERGIPTVYKFAAYYTRKSCDEAWHARSRTDEYSDVMVKFDNGPEELVFGRRTSYRPVWITEQGEFALEELVPRTGDGPKVRPDRTNRFARARIIESNPERVVVQWRYLPSPPADIEHPDPTAFVDEYFVISPDRRIIRALRRGRPRIDDWRDPEKVSVSIIQLRSEGTSSSTANAAERRTALAAMGFHAAEPVEVKADRFTRWPASAPAPAAAWSFDEGRGFSTKEAVGGTAGEIAGHTAYWREGVSGTALAFDGWFSCVELPAGRSPHVGQALTIDAWAALAAYPWNLCPIIQHGDVITSGAGWFLGFTPDARPMLCVSIDGKQQVLEADQRIERYQWAHITGVVDAAQGVMTIYINGQASASKRIPAGKIDTPEEAGIQIAKGPPMKTAWPVRFAVDYQYMIDGLLDEVRVFDKALTADQVKSVHAAFDPGEAARARPDLEPRVLPVGDPAWRSFGAHYTHLRFHSTWDNMFRMSGHPDIVVTFDKSPGRYVLWHGVGYIPMLVTENGRWYSNEFNETWGRGCCEPMSDKKMMFGRVHIVEQSPARVVLRWRYPLSNIYYGIYGEEKSDDGWGEWSEWILTIYPDGSMAKKMRVYESSHHRHEWHESMAIMGPGQHPETVIDKNNTLELVTRDGRVRRYNWRTEPPRGVDYRDTVVHKVNLFAEWDPYTIQSFTGGDVYSGERTEYAVFPSWDHWPVSQMPSDGRKSHFSDRASHSSLTHLRWDFSTAFGDEGQYIEKVLLEGLTRQPAEQLLPMARFFLDPPAVQPQDDSCAVSYDINQKAYVLTRASGEATRLRLDVKASSEQPLVNPAFVVENWGSERTAAVRVEGHEPGDIDIRQGVVRRANGVNALVVWIEVSTSEPLQVTIE